MTMLKIMETKYFVMKRIVWLDIGRVDDYQEAVETFKNKNIIDPGRS